jgi:oligosaccharide repeat unit polymerase
MISMAIGLIAPSLLLIALAGFVSFILFIPMIRTPEIDWFAPWSFVLYSVLVGVFLRSIYITFDIPNPAIINEVFLLGESKDFLLWPMILVVLGSSCLTVGYLSGPIVSRKLKFRVFQSDYWADNRFTIACVVLLTLSWIGFYYFVDNNVTELTLDKLSAKRGIAADLNDYHAYSYLRWMVSLADIVFFICVVRIISTRRIRARDAIFAVLAFATSLLFAVFSSSRGGFAMLFLNVLAFTYYLRGRKVSIVKIALAALIVLFAVKGLTLWRAAGGLEESIRQGTNITEVLDPVILSVTLVDVSKTGHIVAAIPQNLDYQWGWTFATIFVAPIPRDIWPEKPITNADTLVGQAVFGATVYGAGAVPPGLIAESYLNFSVPGVILCCFLCGFLLRFIYTEFLTYSENRNAVLLYVVSFMTLGMFFLGSSVTSVLIGFLTSFTPLFVVLTYITKPVKELDDR